MSEARPRSASALIDAAVLVPYLILGVVFVYWGRYNGDEGWYSLAAANVFDGKQPYEDFLFTQPPLLPHVLGLFYLVLGKSIVVGRWVSLAFGAASIVLVRRACERAGSPRAGLVGALLLSCNAAFVQDTVLVRTQSLTVLCTAVALYGFTRSDSRAKIAIAIAGVTLAGMTRLSLAPLVPVVAAYLWIAEREHRRFLAYVVATAGLLTALVAAHCYSDGNLWFGLYTFHQEIYVGLEEPWWPRFVYFLRHWLADQGAILLLATWAAIGIARPFERAGEARRGLLIALGACFALATAIHVSRQVVYPEYQTSLIVFAVGLGAIGVAPLLARLSGTRMTLALLVPLLVLSFAGQRYEVDLDGRASPATIATAVEALRTASGGEGTLLTPNTELAFETGLELLPGYELSQFSYFATMDDELAERRHVVTWRRFHADIAEATADYVCITPRYLKAYAGERSTEIERMLTERYELIAMIKGYGQFAEPLIIMRRR